MNSSNPRMDVTGKMNDLCERIWTVVSAGIRTLNGGVFFIGMGLTMTADAQIKNDETRDDVYWLVDNTQADVTTGTFKAVKEEKKLPVRVVTFECHFTNTSAVAAPATGK